MADEGASVVHQDEGGNAGKWILLAVAILYVAGSSYLLFDMRARAHPGSWSTVLLADSRHRLKNSRLRSQSRRDRRRAARPVSSKGFRHNPSMTQRH